MFGQPSLVIPRVKTFATAGVNMSSKSKPSASGVSVVGYLLNNPPLRKIAMATAMELP